MKRRLIQHNSIFITRKGGGEEWVRIVGGGRDLNWKLDWANSSGRGRRDKVHEAVDDLVKAIMFNSQRIRG